MEPLFNMETELFEQVAAIRKRNYVKRHTLQPFLAVFGSLDAPTAFYIYVDQRSEQEDLKFCVADIVSALDLCFKSFFVFNVEYGVVARRVWLLLQRELYDIKLPTDKNVNQLASVISDLKLDRID